MAIMYEPTDKVFKVSDILAIATSELNAVEIRITEVLIFEKPYEGGKNIGSVDFEYREAGETEMHMASYGLYTDGSIRLHAN